MCATSEHSAAQHRTTLFLFIVVHSLVGKELVVQLWCNLCSDRRCCTKQCLFELLHFVVFSFICSCRIEKGSTVSEPFDLLLLLVFVVVVVVVVAVNLLLITTTTTTNRYTELG